MCADSVAATMNESRRNRSSRRAPPGTDLGHRVTRSLEIERTWTTSPIDTVLPRLPHARKVGTGGWVGRCPTHEDHHPSLSVSAGVDGKVLVLCRAGCETNAVVEALGLTMADLFPKAERAMRGHQMIVETYDYRDEAGALLYQVCRLEPKDFRTRRPAAADWIWNLRGVCRVLYRLPELIERPDDDVLYPEGEKDADRLRGIGFTATTNLGGAGKWRPEYGEALRGRRVFVLPDNDDAGRRHAAAVKRGLSEVAATVATVELPGLPEKGDVSDWLDAGGTADELRRLLRKAGEKVDGGLDEAVAEDEMASDDPTSGRDPTQATILARLAGEVELFRTLADEPFATVMVGTHLETYPVHSRAMRGWLRRGYWDACHEPIRASALADAIETLAARAQYGEAIHPVGLRVARHEGRLYIDLANAAWEVVEIAPHGWRVVPEAPVRFRRPATMAALPTPVHGGSIDLLRGFANVADENDWRLFVGTLLAAFWADGPFFILILHGEQGSAKSTTARIFRMLVDPSRSPLRAEPRDQRDLLIAAKNNWAIAVDNVSHLPDWLSDALCRLSTGGGFGTRQLYTDEDEIVLDAQRPVVVTAITEIATRGDLLDRVIVLEQPPIREAKRRAEAKFWRSFEAARPLIMGGLCDALASALANEPSVVVDQLPRMADPARWIAAAEPALGWPSGTFLAAYDANRREGHHLALEASPIAAPLQRLAEQGEWRGTAAKLLGRLTELVGDEVKRQRDWPKGPRSLTATLKRLAPNLRAVGIQWERPDRTARSRLHVIRKTGDATVTTVTTVTAIGAVDDGLARDVVVDRHAAARTVTPDRAPHDGRDGRDGSAPRLVPPELDPRAPMSAGASSDEELTLWTG